MKKFLLLITICLLAFLGTRYWTSQKHVPAGVAVQSSSQTSIPSPTLQEPTKTTTSLPKRLIIPSISVNAEIESVGMDSKGNMDVPVHSDNAAWYNLGFKPGENGSAVIDGHFDKVTGAPAVFYNLASLKPNDTIQIEEDDGKTLTFTVLSSQVYPFDSLPLQKIFNSPGKPTLNLITCDGVFNKSQKNYSQRLVVYAELASN